MTTKRKYSWIRDLPDFRDQFYRVAAPVTLPPAVDLRSVCPPVYDEGELGSCTANAIAGAHQFEQMKQLAPTQIGGLGKNFPPSRLFIYYNERVIEHSAGQDSGAQIRDGMKSVAKQGVCPEPEWPYIIGKFANKPTPACYADAMNHQVTSYQKVIQTAEQMKQCLAAGYPFVFGFSVYSSFESKAVAKTGKVPLPKRNESQLGGHAVMCVGFRDKDQVWIVRNSWGSGWGDKGYCYFPYQYLTDPSLCSDLWTVRLVEVP